MVDRVVETLQRNREKKLFYGSTENKLGGMGVVLGV